jgi:polyisoprenoid-binding protein YceI
MNRFLLTVLALLLTGNCIAQNVWLCTNAKTSFFSRALVENIDATSNTSSSAINFQNNQVYIKISIRDFSFKNKLMEEHFNENYLESEKYPVATFVGHLTNPVNVKDLTSSKVNIDGELTIHGVAKAYSLSATLSKTDEKITAASSFNVKLEDHKIKIPKLLFEKIAETIEVSYSGLFYLKP